MKKEFINVNNAIFDYKKYVKEVEWLRHDIKQKISDILEKDFILVEKFEESYDKLHMVFYNKKIDIRIEVECLKQTPERFI
jgi:hypothetical protein